MPRVKPLFPVRVSPQVVSFLPSFSEATPAPKPELREFTRVAEAAEVPARHYANKLRPSLPWMDAAKVQFVVVRNALGCVLVAMVTNACFYSGNVFSLRSSCQQSRGELIVATLLWSTLSYCFIMLVAHLPSMTNLQFIASPDRRPGLWFCAKKLLRGSGPYFIATLCLMLGLGLLVVNTALLTTLFPFKLHYYLGDLVNLVYTAGLTLVARRIYYQETCQGRERLGGLQNPRKIHHPPAASYRPPSIWQQYVTNFPKALPVALAGGYVQLVNDQQLLERGTIAIAGFTVFSVVLKLALQEATRWYVLKYHVRSIRSMCVLVGVPTVLLDTQARIVLLGSQNNQVLVAGTFAMAVAEVALRATKAALVKWHVRHREEVVEMEAQKLAVQSHGPALEAAVALLRMEFDLWQRQVLAFHSAELTADMYAEYIAIGCSQSILFWYAGHTFYPTLRLGGDTVSGIKAAWWRFTQVAMLGFQFAVEIGVDYVCVVLEMAAGLPFDHLRDLGAFLATLFMALAVLNINISAIIYLT
ncbi:hypothetical protein BBJ28_00014791 [Nothophytophthora sp. Chile5]|nr:hypothetical protein BBJ28_00014791 [Nothophytophthora sp. Chile5]